MFMTNPWDNKFLQMIADVAQNESEEEALRMLNQGSSIIEAQTQSGLSYESFHDLMERANKYESEAFCNGTLNSDTHK